MRVERFALRIYRALRRVGFRIGSVFAKQSPSQLRTDQETRFRAMGLSRDLAVKTVQQTTDPGQRFSSETSEHYLLFAALAAKGFSPQKVLEIGTFDGRFARFLSSIFPAAAIHTIDLPQDQGLAHEYGRNRWAEYERVRSSNLQTSPRITLIEQNSLSLTLEPGGAYDLIWVDGHHGYPTAAADIVNSLRLLKAGGIVCVDDVYKSVVDPDELLRSLASFQTLSALKDAGLVRNFWLIRKRLAPGKNLPWTEKFIAFAVKPEEPADLLLPA